MEEIILEAEVRSETGRGKAKDMRDAGFVPAVVYAGGKDSTPIKVSHSALVKLVHQQHRIEGVVINLKIKDDKKKSRPCLIKEIQYEPVRGGIVHVDFNEISLTKAIKVNVPVTAKGEAVGVKQEGGSLEHVLWEVEIECLPTSIPKEIEVDVTNLKMGEGVHIRDIVPPPGVKILNDQNAVVISVAAPMKVEAAPVEEALEGAEKKEPEVIKEKKVVPGEGEAAEGKEAKEGKEGKEKK